MSFDSFASHRHKICENVLLYWFIISVMLGRRLQAIEQQENGT